MADLFSWLVALPPLLLLAAGLVPSRVANRRLSGMRWAAAGLLGVSCVASVVASALLWQYGPLDVALIRWNWPLPINWGIYFDSLSAVMTLLVSFIGFVIARYSSRYLDGEATQGRFLRWMMATVGAVLTMVVARNLLMFTAAWMLTSYGLHQLLTHYPERPWAVWAARKKFLISRLGDVMLIAALALTYNCFGSFDYQVVFAGAERLGQGVGDATWSLSIIAMLFVIGAMTKSAQAPFHSWLPDTMETPTPVSALMHAGVINAGGFLVIRLSPLISQSHAALDFLSLVGAFTAILGAVVMLTQTSVKRVLAYSTIAQMGFMMLQCGQGAFSAALLHIVAHSLYKAHAFLSSGSVLDSAATLNTQPPRPISNQRYWSTLPVAMLLALGLGYGSVWLWGIEFSAKPGATILGLILALALTHLIWQSLTADGWRIAIRGIASAAVVCLAYLGAWLAIDTLLATSVSHRVLPPSPHDIAVISIVALGFIALFVLQAVVTRATRSRSTQSSALRSLYVHASNGFYLDIPARRLTARIWGGAAPTP